MLTQHDFDLEVRDFSSYHIVLHLAAKWGYVSVLKLVLDAGASINCRNRTCETPTLVAAEANRMELVRCLMDHGAYVAAADRIGSS